MRPARNFTRDVPRYREMGSSERVAVKHLSDAEAALREARQEAGVVGRIECEPIGSYRYQKIEKKSSRLVEVYVFLLSVSRSCRKNRRSVPRTHAGFAESRQPAPSGRADIAKSVGANEINVLR